MKPFIFKPASSSVVISDDGALLATTGPKNVFVFNLQTGRKLWSKHPFSWPSQLDFSPDGSLLAVKNTSGQIAVFEAESGALVCDFRNEKEGEGCSPCFGPAGDVVFDGSWGGLLTVRAARDGVIRWRTRREGERIGGISHDHQRKLWLVERAVKATEAMPAKDTLFIYTWALSDALPRQVPPQRAAYRPRLSPDGSRIAFVEEIVDEEGDKALEAMTLGATEEWSYERLRELTRDSDRLVTIDATTGSRLAQGAPVRVTPIPPVWSPDCRYVAYRSDDRFVFYRSDDLSVAAIVPAEYPTTVVFHPDGTHVVLGNVKSGVMVSLADIFAGGFTL